MAWRGTGPHPTNRTGIIVVRGPVPRESDLLSNRGMAGDRPPPYGPLSRHSMAGDNPPLIGIIVVRGPVPREPDSLSRHSMAGDRPPPYEPRVSCMAEGRPLALRTARELHGGGQASALRTASPNASRQARPGWPSAAVARHCADLMPSSGLPMLPGSP